MKEAGIATPENGNHVALSGLSVEVALYLISLSSSTLFEAS
jgi:hypothetical protein